MKRFVLVLAMVLFVAPIAYADGFYVSINGGISSLADSDIYDGYDRGEISYDAGFTVLGSIGYALQNVRLEIEGGYRKNDIDKAVVYGIGSGPIPGEIESKSIMGNFIYEFLPDKQVRPFVGGGIGIAKLEAQIANYYMDDTVFAGQFILGIGFMVDKNVSLTVQYRAFVTEDPNFHVAGGVLESEYFSNTGLAGLRIAF